MKNYTIFKKKNSPLTTKNKANGNLVIKLTLPKLSVAREGVAKYVVKTAKKAIGNKRRLILKKQIKKDDCVRL